MGEIKRQSIRNTVLSYIGALLGFVIVYFQPHFISSGDIGLLRLLYSFSWMTAIIMPFGIGSAIMRYFPKIQNNENGHNGLFALLLMLGSGGAVIIAIALLVFRPLIERFFMNSPQLNDFFLEAIAFAYILSLVSLYTTFSSSLLKTTFAVFLTDVFTRLGQIVVVLLYYFDIVDHHSFVISYIAIFFLQLLLLVIYLYRSGAVSFKIDFGFYRSLNLKHVFYFSVLMMFTAFASLGIKVIDQLMVGHFLNENLVGIYATSVMMCVIMEIPFNSLDRIASPKIAYAWNFNDTAEIQKIYEMSSRYMFFVGGVIFCALWSAVDLIFLFLPAEYAQGRSSLIIVSVASLINLCTGINSSVITFSGKYYVLSFLLVLLICIAYLANNFLIPVFGISGAAWATLIAIGVYNLLKYLYIRIQFGMQPFSRFSLYTVCCIILSAGGIALLPDGVNPWYKCIIGGIVTAVIFSAANIKYGIVPEVNKLLKLFETRLNPIKKKD